MSIIHQIVNLFLEGEYSEETKKKFYRWFFSSKSKLEKEEVLVNQWNEIDIEADSSTRDSYNKVITNLGIEFKKKQHLEIRYKLLRIAAAIFIPVISIISIYWYVQSSDRQSVEFVEHFTPNSNIETINLPDGSFVTVNCGSIIIYPRNFTNKSREIFLSGEAKFTVAPDKKRPFIVKTNDMNIEALGTVFNVSSYAENSQTVATLVNGKARVGMKKSKKDYILEPLQQVVFDKETGKSFSQQAKIDLELAWEVGHLVFRNASIEDIMQEIQRKYDVRIYANYKKIKNEKLTVKFNNDEPIEEIFNTLRMLIKGFDYKIEGEKIYIYQ
jgi:ferric-dicitrate binding protein FerR (iron transport regulator)